MSSGHRESSQRSSLPPLFRPFPLRDVTFPNRVVVTPMCQYCADDGHAAEWHLAHHGRFSLGGVGGALVEATAVTRDGRITHGCLGIYRDSHVERLSQITGFYRAHGIPIGIQLAHAGRKASAALPFEGAAPLTEFKPSSAWETIAPSAIPMTEGWPTPRAMTVEEIHRTIDAFVQAALRAIGAGFDFIEIHGAHGYLVNSFFSPISNRRDDEWGGPSMDNRLRFPVRVAEALRSAMPASMPLLYRTSSVDGIEGGIEIDDTVILAQALKSAGVDLIDCSSGGIIGPSGRALTQPSPGYLVPYAEEVRRSAEIPTMAVGLITEAEQANEIIAAGRADLVAMGRQMMHQSNFAYHAAEKLGHPDPCSQLPDPYAFWLRRR